MPVTTQNCNTECQDQLGDKDLNGKQVHHSFHATLLVSNFLTVHHNPSLSACVNYEADNPLRVLEVSTLQEELVVRKREVALFSDMQVTVKAVQVSVGYLTVDLSGHHEISRVEIGSARWNELVEFFGRSLRLEVLLTIK